MNKFIGIGRLTKDIELRSTQSGVTCANFTIAINRKFKGTDGQYQADFLNCVAWRNTAEFINTYFRKGDSIAVCGAVQTRTWEEENGNKRYATEIIVDSVDFCGSKKENETKKSNNNIDDFIPIENDEDISF